jgi:hypothetical protein
VSSLEDIGLRAHARAALAQRLTGSGEAIVTAAQEARAHGVVIWMIEEESSLGWTLPDQLAALKRADLPSLALTRQNWAAEAGALQTLEDFCARLGDSR